MTSYLTTSSPVRIMFPNLAKPREMQKGKPPRYGCLVLLKKDSEDLPRLKQAIIAAMEESFGSSYPLSGRCNPIKDCVTTDKKRELEQKSPMFEKLENAEDYVFFNASSQNRPGMVDAKLDDLLDMSVFKSGCYVNVNVNAWTWENSGDKGVSIGLNHVQFIDEGESLATSSVETGNKGAKVAFKLQAPVADAAGGDDLSIFG